VMKRVFANVNWCRWCHWRLAVKAGLCAACDEKRKAPKPKLYRLRSVSGGLPSLGKRR
jgi:hypothetical protein